MTKNLSGYLSKEKLEERELSIETGVKNEYERDITAILYSKPFSRLRHKTQVFFDPKNDHICTRMEHSLHVASIARTIAEYLNLNSHLAEAIGLGHDIGHPPFGHAGEELIHELIKEKCPDVMSEKYYLNINSSATKKNRKPLLHNINGLLWASHITKEGEGLKLTYAVRDGILSHCGIDDTNRYILKLFNQEKDLEEVCRTKNIELPITVEGCIVRLADTIAFRTRDFEDCIRAKIIEREDLPQKVKTELGTEPEIMIDNLIGDLIDGRNENLTMSQQHPEDIKIGFSPDKIEALEEFGDFFNENVYEQEKIIDFKIAIKNVIFAIYDYLLFKTEKIADEIPPKDIEEKDISYLLANFNKFKKKPFLKDWPTKVIIVYFIAGCSDKYIQQCINDILTFV